MRKVRALLRSGLLRPPLTGVVVLALACLFAVSPVGSVHGGSAVSPPRETMPSPGVGAALASSSEGAGLPRAFSPTDLGVVYTTDSRAGNNGYLASDFAIPNGDLVVGQNWTILEAEPVNSTMTIAVGMFGFENATGPEWWPEMDVWNDHGRPENVTVLDREDPLHAGATVHLILKANYSDWWNFSIGSTLVTSPGFNGTLDLGTPIASGFSPTAPLVQWPSLIVEGNTTTMPFSLHLQPVLEYTSGLNPPDLLNHTWAPQNGIWWQNAPGWRVGGEDQLGPVTEYTGSLWELWMGQTVPLAPANGSWLWGFGGPLVHPYANVTTDGAFSTNTGFGVELDLNSSSFGEGASSYLVTAWERLAPGVAVGVGAWVNAPGGAFIPYYAKNVSGEAIQYIGDTNTPPVGHPQVLLAWPDPGGIWNFSDNGAPLIGGENSYALGQEWVGPTVAPAGSEAFITIDSVGPVSPGLSGLALSPAILLNVSGQWESSPAGFVGPTGAPPCGPCVGAPLEGYLQDPLLPPGQAFASAGLASLPVGTTLWDGTSYPPVSVAWSGIPSQVRSYENLTATVWVNGTSGPVPSPAVVVDLPSGVQAGAITYPAAGMAEVPLEFADTADPVPLTLAARGGGNGYLPANATITTELEPGTLALQGHLDAPSLAPGQSATIVLWVNGTDGTGPRTDVTLSATSSLGASVVAEGLQAGGTDFAFGYTAPSVDQLENDTVAILAQVPGFDPDVGLVLVPLAPPEMTLAVRESPNPALSGSDLQVVAWLNATATGAALPGAAFAAGFQAYGSVAAVVPTEPSPGEYSFEVPAPLVPANSTLFLSVSAQLAGYRTVTDQVPMFIDLPSLVVAVDVLAPQGGIYEIVVQTSYLGAGIAGAELALDASGGTLAAPSLTSGPHGFANFTWDSPSGPGGTFTFSLNVFAAGFLPADQTFTIQVPSGSGTGNGPSGLAPAWLLVAPAIVIAVFLLLWIYGRQRSKAGASGKGTKEPAKPAPEKKWAGEGSGSEEKGPPSVEGHSKRMNEPLSSAKDGKAVLEGGIATEPKAETPASGAAGPVAEDTVGAGGTPP